MTDITEVPESASGARRSRVAWRLLVGMQIAVVALIAVSLLLIVAVGRADSLFAERTLPPP